MTDPKPTKPTPAKAQAAKSATAKTASGKTTPVKTAAAVPPVVPAPVISTPVVATPAVATAAAASSAAPGWYYIAAGSTQQRWWDGNAWTEHTYEPVASVSQFTQPKAPEGTSPTTVWIWITAASPVLSIVGSILSIAFVAQLANFDLVNTSQFSSLEASPTYIIASLLGLVSLVAAILFPVLDWRELGKRGVPNPFHWAWSLAAVIIGSPIVYVIGRTVVVKRRTGKGMAPLWVFVAVQVIAWIFGLVVIVALISAIVTLLSNLVTY